MNRTFLLNTYISRETVETSRLVPLDYYCFPFPFEVPYVTIITITTSTNWNEEQTQHHQPKQKVSHSMRLSKRKRNFVFTCFGMALSLSAILYVLCSISLFAVCCIVVVGVVLLCFFCSARLFLIWWFSLGTLQFKHALEHPRVRQRLPVHSTVNTNTRTQSIHFTLCLYLSSYHLFIIRKTIQIKVNIRFSFFFGGGIDHIHKTTVHTYVCLKPKVERSHWNRYGNFSPLFSVFCSDSHRHSLHISLSIPIARSITLL